MVRHLPGHREQVWTVPIFRRTARPLQYLIETCCGFEISTVADCHPKFLTFSEKCGVLGRDTRLRLRQYPAWRLGADQEKKL